LQGFSNRGSGKVIKENTTMELLRSLSEQEWADLELFLQSPYFNRGVQAERLLRLYEVLRSAGGSLPDKAVLTSDIFAGESAPPGKMDKLLSEFNGLLREFLLLQYQKNTTDAFNEALHWAVILRQKGLMKRYDAAMQKAEKVLKAERVESLELYYNRFKLEYEKYSKERLFNIFNSDFHANETIFCLDNYYLLCRSEIINVLLSLERVVLVNVPEHFRQPQKHLIHKENDWEGEGLLKVSLSINEQFLQKYPSSIGIAAVFDILKKNEHVLSDIALQNYFAHLRNLCALRIKAGDKTLLQVLHDIQSYSLEKGYILLMGKISPSAYLTIVIVAVKVNKVSWALEFVSKYKEKIIDPNMKELYYDVAKGMCFFYQGDIDECLSLLPSHTADMLLHTNAKRLEIKCYYELQSELLPYKIEAYKVFLSRASKKLLSPDIRDFEGNFVNLLLQIINCPPGDAFKLERLERRIQEKTTVADRDWLLQKVAAMRGK